MSKEKLPWSKFFWTDWESDPALRLCSFAAQGLWMRMLCIAAAHDPIGYVAVNGLTLDASSLARMTGGTEPEVNALVAELERNGVFSRDRQGRIYSRRLIRDAKLSKSRAEAGRNGGRASAGKYNGNSGLLEQNDSKRKANAQAKLKPQKPEARSQNSIIPSNVETGTARSRGPDKPQPPPDRHPWIPTIVSACHGVFGEIPTDFGIVVGWARDGCDLERDVMPAIDDLAGEMRGKGKLIGSFRFFDREVRGRHRARQQADEREMRNWERMVHGNVPGVAG